MSGALAVGSTRPVADKKTPCTVCSEMPTHLVHERRPGAKGQNAQSMIGCYYLCDRCLQRVERIGTVEWPTWRYNRIVIPAKTFAWLKNLARSVTTER